MQKIMSKLTVFFDAPFWVGVYERFTDGTLEVCKITFGAEPKDYEVYQFLLENWNNLRFSPSVETEMKKTENINPKRMQRAIKKQVMPSGIGTKSQQALKLQHEQNKQLRKAANRKQKEDEKRRQFELYQQKRKERHRGR